MKKISVIVPTYNRPEFLPITLQSIINQYYQKIQIILVNDGGKEPSEALEYYSKNKREGLELTYVHKPNGGLWDARNVGLSRVTGDYIAFLDDDDTFYPYHLSTLVAEMEKNNLSVIYSDAICHVLQKKNNQYVTQVKQIVYSIDYNHDLLLVQNISPVNCFVFSKKLLEKYYIRFEDYRVYEDWLFWIELAKQTDFVHYPYPTCEYTFRNDGSTMSSSRTEFTTLLPEIYRRNFPLAKNPLWTAQMMNRILVSRGLDEMFEINTN
jgi:glycosyltransferase involved in cell wall biosynthesis